MKNKINKSWKIKLWSFGFGLGVLSAVVTTAVSCSNPNVQTINSLFTNSNGPLSEFTNSTNGSIKNILAKGLLQNNGYQTLMKTKLGEILGIWYSKNTDQVIKDHYQNFVNETNDAWNNKENDYKQNYGNDYQVRLQTEVLDPVGGTKDSWIQDQVNQKVLSDFGNQIFAKSFLNYVDPLTSMVSNITPSINVINNQTNWNNIKFAAPNGSSDNDQMFAKFQDLIFNQWVSIENPSLVSKILFGNEEPQNGLNSIFNQDIIGADNLKASYEFQTFRNNLNDPTAAKGMNAYKTIATTGLEKYYNSLSNTIDLPNIFSSDAGGKTLMTASDMFNSYDVAFTSAFVYQYLKMLGNTTTDMIVNKFNLPSATATDAEFNIMNNFIVKNSAVVSTTEYTGANASYTNILNPFRATNFYQSYSKLSDPTTKIFNVAVPQAADPTKNDVYNQFLFTRGKDGVYLIGIDGGKYYLDSATKSRNTSKQGVFLKYRAYLASLPNGLSASNSYTFDLNAQLKTWFDAHQVSLIYQVLSQLDNENWPLLNSVPDFKTAFENFKNKFDSYINAFIVYNQVLNVQADADTMRSKLNAWAQTYSDNLKNQTPQKIGIAAKLPYVRANDGDYFGQLQYYLEILDRIDPTLNSSTASITDLAFNIPVAKDHTRQALIDETANLYDATKNQIAKLLDSLDLQTATKIQYSQNLFVESKNDASLYLALNLVINETLTSESTINSIKTDYLDNNSDFKTIASWAKTSTSDLIINNSDASTTTIAPDLLLQAIKNFYQQAAFNSLSDKTIYGNFINLNDLNEKVNIAWENLLGFDQYSTNSFNYNLFLYTLYYLLKDNLTNFKTILSSQIYQGVDAFVSWSVPTNPNTLDPKDPNTNPITKFDANSNYIQGAGWKNDTTTNTNAVNEWFNTTVIGAGGGSTTTVTQLNPNPFNDTATPYSYTSSVTGMKLFGFNGISTSSSNANLDANVATTIFNYDGIDNFGSLYSFGTKDDLLSYIKSINNQVILDNLAQKLSKITDVAAYFQQDDQNRDVNDFDQKQAILEKAVSAMTVDNFSKFTGFIGVDEKAAITTTTDFNAAYAKITRGWINESGNKRLSVVPILIQQINFEDVKQLGTGKWADISSNNSGRLGLDLSAFLSLLVQQAQDPQTQNQAISYLISSQPSRFIIGDKRLYDALGSQWVTK